MTVGIEWRYATQTYDHRPLPYAARPQRVFAGLGFAAVALACVWTAYVNGSSGSVEQGAATDGGGQIVVGRRGDRLVVAQPQLWAPARTYLSLLDPRYLLGYLPETFASGKLAESTAPRRPLRLLPRLIASRRDSAIASAAAAASPEKPPTIFEKLFGRPSPIRLAYAAPDDTGLGGGEGAIAPRYDRWTAVYDISTHTVYMPDGNRLEAHSGLGSRLDDPRHVNERMRGATPPAVYDLVPREALFHGVRALRLIPLDGEEVFGRSGLLAHSYMLGPNGASNGCVSFRNYKAFLEAYLHHEIRRLAVVAHL